MAGLLTNGTYVLVPEQDPDYGYAMFDAEGNFAEGIKRADGNYSYAFQRYYTSATTAAAYQIVPKYVTLKEMNDVATSAAYMCSACRFLERVEGHFNNVKDASYMFANCSALQYLPDNCFNNVVSARNMFQGCLELKEIPSNSFNGIINPNALASFTTSSYSLSSWGSNTFNSVTGVFGALPTSVSAMKNIDGWATSFEMARGLNMSISSDTYSGYRTVTSNLIPIIDHFKNKTVPLISYTAHMFRQFTAAADYQECVNSPTYSAWVV